MATWHATTHRVLKSHGALLRSASQQEPRALQGTGMQDLQQHDQQPDCALKERLRDSE